jgi:hypothetical protein
MFIPTRLSELETS